MKHLFLRPLLAVAGSLVFAVSAILAEEPAPQKPTAIKLDPGAYSTCTGPYRSESDTYVVISTRGDHLTVELPGQAAVELIPVSESRFTFDGLKGSLVLERDGSGAVTQLVAKTSGTPLRAAKISPLKIDPQLLNAYQGEYRFGSDYAVPNQTLFVTREGNWLKVELDGQETRELWARSDSEFFFKLFPGQHLTFVRDDHGQVTQLLYDAPGIHGQAVKGEYSMKREEVTFQHGNITLSGDLLTPPGPGPFPVFIWCHGSGKASREWVLWFARSFVKSGYAFLAWDKRGVGKSTGQFYQQSLSDRATEMLAAAEMLMKRKDIDAQRVSFCGGSQAGYVLPRVIKAFPKAEKLVLIGPCSWSFSEERAYQRQTAPLKTYLPMVGVTDPHAIDEILELLGKMDRASDADFVDAYLAFHEEAKGKPWYQKAQTLIPPPPTDPDELRDFKLFFREAFAFDAIQEYSGINCPTLILFGEKDENENPKVGIPNIRAGFEKSGNAQLSVIVYPGASHALGGAGDKPKRDLADWLARTTPASGEQ